MTSTIADARAQGHAEIAKSNGQAQALAGIAGTMLSIGATGLTLATLPGPARAAGWAAVATFAVAMGAVLLALRPSLRGNFGIVRWARLDPAALDADLRTPGRGDQELAAAMWLSRAARRKHRLVRAAIDLMLASPAVALAAAVTTWLL